MSSSLVVRVLVLFHLAHLAEMHGASLLDQMLFAQDLRTIKHMSE